MKRILLLFSLFFFFHTNVFSQCINLDSDNDGVLDCIDPCPNVTSSKIGNLSFESDFIGWTIPQNSSFFSINENANHTLHGGKSLYVSAPNAANFENYAIYSEEFILEEDVAYNFKIPVKRVGNIDGDALRWVLIDENGIYRHFNNYYSITEEWFYIEFTDFFATFGFYTSNKFRLGLEFGLSTTDMVIDKIEFYESAIGQDPAYKDLDADGIPDCTPFSAAEHPDYEALVSFYNSLNGQNWINNTNWLDTTKPLSTWYGITETNGRVSSIKFDNNGLFGNIPEELTNLTELEIFWISNASLYGEIPLNIGELSNLRQVVLFQTYGLTGNIPESIKNCSNLEWLYVANNQLEGAIPNLKDLSNLSVLSIENNNFEFGDFETEFASYQSTMGNNFVYAPQSLIGQRFNEALGVGNSTTFNANVSGTQNNYNWYRINADGSEGGFIASGETIDVTINTTDDYKWFYYYDATNTIVPGLTLRSEFFKIDDLPSNHPDYNALLAVYNALNGPNWNVPWDINAPIQSWSNNIQFDGTSNRVSGLYLRGNDKSGQLPKAIGDLTGLKFLTVESSENITGNIPQEIGNLTNLEALYFWHCDYSGEVPLELWTLSNLKNIFIGNQKSKALTLSNGIPSSISNLQNLELLDLNGIHIAKPLPTELFGLSKLNYILLNNCSLGGELPHQFSFINNVYLSNNNFEGTIPQQIVEATGNSLLNISGNYFDFSDLEPLVQANNYQFLNYSPQRTKDIELDLKFAPGENITFSIDDTRYNKTKNTKGVGDIYQWYKNNVAISGANSSSYTITSAEESDSGTFFCKITNNLVPGLVINRANITLLIDSALSITKNKEEGLMLFPNPVTDILTVKLSANISKITLYDMSGKQIYSKNVTTNNARINTSNLNSGVYLLRLKTNENTIIKRIVKL